MPKGCRRTPDDSGEIKNMEQTKNPALKLSDNVYNKLKFVSLVLLPAVSTLYFTMSNVWGFGNTEKVIGTIAALDAFIGIFLGISTKLYNASDSKYDGIITIEDRETGAKMYSLELHSHPSELDNKSSVIFKVGGSK